MGTVLEHWAAALVITAAVFAASTLARRAWLGHLRRRVAEGRHPLDEFFEGLVAGTNVLALLAVSAAAGVSIAAPEPTWDHFVGIFAIIVLLLQVAVWGSRVITFALRTYVQHEMAEDATAVTTFNALGLIAKIILWAGVFLLALANLGVNITALVAGLGVSSIAVALAVQNILGDVFASISIALDKPFVIGDFITVDTLSGTVEYVGLKSTRIRSLTGEIIVVSNSDLLKSRIRNYKHLKERRITFVLGVAYESTAEQLEAIPAIVREVVSAQPAARFDRSNFKDFGAYSLDFETVYYVTTPDYYTYMNTQEAINLALFRRFAAEGIVFAYPTQTLYVSGQSGSAVAPATGTASPPP